MNLTTSVRIAIASTAILASSAAVGFAMGYSAIGENDARYLQMKLPVATEWFITVVPFSPIAVILFAIIMVTAAARRMDSALIVAACIGWLLSFSWSLLAVFVWRTPMMLIGAHISR